MRAIISISLVLALTASGCSAATDTPGENVAQTAAPLDPFLNHGAVTHASASGHWSKILGCSGLCVHSLSFWVDIEVQDLAYDKQVGIVWTMNDWATQTTSYASYEGSLPNGRQRWGVDVEDFTSSIHSRPSPAYNYADLSGDVEYAVFAVMNGQTYWAPYNNYYIWDSVTAAEPVRLLDSSVEAAATVPHLTGTARALNVTAPRKVFVVYTTDGWATSAEAEAELVAEPFHSDYAFDIALARVAPETSNEVEFALRFEALGEQHWDNHDGQNYRHQLSPVLSSAGLPAYEGAVDGILVYAPNLRSDLPFESVETCLDDSSCVQHDFVSGSTYVRPERVLYTPNLRAGAHSLELTATTSGGFERELEQSEFSVAKKISGISNWDLPLPSGASAGSASIWQAVTGHDGKVYVLWNEPNTFARYDSFGASSEELLGTPAPFAGRPTALAVDGSSRVYLGTGLGAELARWTSAGALDMTFGSGGVLDLAGSVGSKPLCYLADLQCQGDRLYVVDSCNTRLVSLNLDGAVQGELNLAPAPDYTTNLRAIHVAGDKIFALVQRYPALSLVEIATDTLSIVSSSPVPGAQDLNYLTSTSDGFWSLRNSGAVAAWSASQLATWHGGGASGGELVGAFDLGVDVFALSGAHVGVVDAQQNRIARFTRTAVQQ